VNGAATTAACEQCGGDATRTVGGRLLCDGLTCDKGQGTRNEEKDKGRTEGVVVFPLSLVPCPRGSPSRSSMVS
jgi:hypothetical protein